MKKRIFQRLLGVLLVLCGLTLFLYPDVRTWLLNRNTQQYVKNFDAVHDPSGGGSAQENGPDGENNRTKEKDPLYQEILAYNTAIFEEGQEDFRDTYSYTQAPVSLESLDTDEFGYIEIPAMDVTLPLYIGASDENMSRGAAVLGQTSIPIGGTNTNSVIAGHRGWRGGPYFLYIENLSVGDEVYITNPWETLIYTVESIDIIDPYDSDAVRIQEGKDMVTLVTCHPYLSHGKYRYVVYCVRDGENVSGETDHVSQDENTTLSDGAAYGSSRDTIRKEKMLRRAGAVAILAMTLITFLYCRKNKKKK